MLLSFWTAAADALSRCVGDRRWYGAGAGDCTVDPSAAKKAARSAGATSRNAEQHT